MSRTPLDSTDVLIQIHEALCEYLSQIADRLIRSTPAPLPSRWARVHAMGNQSFTGEVEALERGAIRIRYLDSEITQIDLPPDLLRAAYHYAQRGQPVAVDRTKDIRAIHSIDWLTESQYMGEVEQVQQAARKNVTWLYRCKNLPDGYKLGEREHVNGLEHAFVCPDGRARGWWYDDEAARHEAWRHADNPKPIDDDVASELKGAEPAPTEPPPSLAQVG